MFLIRDEKEERSKQSTNKQTRQSNTAHPRQSLFLEKMSCLGWDSNPRHSTLYCTCMLLSACVHTCIHVHVHVHVCCCLHVSIRAYMYMYMYVVVCMCPYMHICTCTCIYTLSIIESVFVMSVYFMWF